MADLEKEFYSLLSAFDKYNALKHLVLIGSWALKAHKVAISQKRAVEDAEIKMIKDLEGAAVIIESMNEPDIIKAAARYPGKFKNLFEKGLEIYKSKFKYGLPYSE